MSGKKIVATLLMLPLLAITASGCAPKDIPFETVARQLSTAESPVLTPQLQAIASVPSSPLSGIIPEDEAKLRAIDYSEYVALTIYFGSGASDEDNINSISQQGNVVFVRAELLPASDGERALCPYQIVRIKKAAMPLNGTATFKLMDQFGKEMAAVTQKLMP